MSATAAFSDTGNSPKPLNQRSSAKVFRVSVTAAGENVLRYFLIALTILSVSAACLENGLHPGLLVLLPVIAAALWRRDYGQPFVWSERIVTLLFFVYVLVFSAGIVALEGRLALPLFMVYFTFGILMLRVLSPLTDRNLSQVIALSFGLVLINCILTNHLIFGLMLPVYLFVWMGTLLLFQLARNKTLSGEPVEPPSGKRFRESWYGKLAVYSLLVLGFTSILFVFVPRPFLVIPGLRAAMAHAGGLAELERRIAYREMTGMSGRNRIAFKIKLEHGRLPEFPYWRGRVLDKFNGRAWEASNTFRGMGKIIRASDAEKLVYRIMPFRLHSKTIYVSGLPVQVTGRLGRPLYVSASGEVVVDSPFLFSDSYEVTSVNRPVPASYRPEPINLDTEGLTPRIRQLAQGWTSRFNSPRDKAGVVMSRLRADYTYRLQPPAVPVDTHPVEYFLFESRAGNCEHFAGALCLMLRAVGVPARVVEGFAGMEDTPAKDEFIVRFARAHAWVEALLDGANWTSLDATPAMSGELARSRVWRFLTDLYDNVEYQWIKRVVYFDRADQADMFRGLSRLFSGQIPLPLGKVVAWLGYWLGALLGGIVLLAALIYVHHLRNKKTNISEIYINTMRYMVRKGVLSRVHPWHEDNTLEILERSPQCGDALSRFMAVYMQGRFGQQTMQVQNLAKARQELLQSVQAVAGARQ